MGDFFSNIKSKVSSVLSGEEVDNVNLDEGEKEYVELDTTTKTDTKGKILVRPFIINDFSDIKIVLDSLREGSVIALLNIKPLKDKDLIELKRVINKLKKTTDALEGDIAGFGEDYIVVTPNFARIYRAKASAPKVEEQTVSSGTEEL